MNKKVMLVILDGWGIAKDTSVSAVDKANTPYIDSLYQQYPHATLRTDGMNVGLPDGQMGNSEVGHMNLGAGRIVYQDLAKINRAIAKNTLQNEPVLQRAFDYAKEFNKPVHFIGLLSNGGVHSHIDHLKGLLKASRAAGVTQNYIHAFTDGRDVDPQSGIGFIKDLTKTMEATQSKLASITGRYYAMDRDKRWERTKVAYDALVYGDGALTTTPLVALKDSYEKNITDEFIKPIIIAEDEKPTAVIQANDVVIFFNFRTDRGRQLTDALSQRDLTEHGMAKLPLYFITLTMYDETFHDIKVVFTKEHLKETLGAVLERNGKTQLRAAETEKYPHVTFFFSGGREKPYKGETRIIANSPKVATYDLQPEMSAYELTTKVTQHIENVASDFICLNFANPDMVGHTGNFDAAVKACETVDACVKKVIDAAKNQGYSVLVIADHGNSELMVNPDGSPNTAHTTNPVPVILVDSEIQHIKDGILGDVAPTILHLMGMAKPKQMTRNSLL